MADPDPNPSEMSVDHAIRLAVQLHQDRQFKGAEQLYRRILAVVPDHPDVLHFLGVLRHAVGASDEGVALIRRAIELAPDFVGFHNNLGNLHAQRGEVKDATAAYERAIALAPDSADLHNNLGALYQAEGRADEAMASCRRAIELDPGHANAHNNIALIHADAGDLDHAIRWYCKSLELRPGNLEARRRLGYTYYLLGQIAQAAEVFRQWMEHEPDNPVPRHMYAACSGSDAPSRAPDDFVERIFDGFASSFESQLNEHLQYRAPQLCGEMLARVLPAPARQFVMLDAGCGTGLCGSLMAPWARVLEGVDLSRGMLDRAQSKGVYHELYKAELTQFLAASPAEWDVVVCADTLCYFGDLAGFGSACRAAMSGGGTLVFTVEALLDNDHTPFRLRPHGRYEHSRLHIEEVLRQSGFELLELRPVTLRMEALKPVHGWLVAARASARIAPGDR